jgi:hypothetical protein
MFLFSPFKASRLVDYHINHFGLMNDMPASIFEHIASKGNHVISFGEFSDLFFSYSHVVTIPHNRIKCKLFLSFFFFFIVIFFHFLLDRVFSINLCKSLVINELWGAGGRTAVSR